MSNNGTHFRSRGTHRKQTRRSHSHSGYLAPLMGGEAAGEQWAIDGVVEPGGIPPGTVHGASLIPDTLGITPFADTIRPVAIVATLPTLPDLDYPLLSYVVLTSDSRLYKNIGGSWVLGVNGADIVADSITAAQIAAGAISASEISAGAITADKLSVGANVGMGSNAVVNSSFEDHVAGVASGWTTGFEINNAGWSTEASISAIWSRHGARVYQVSVSATTNGEAMASKSFPVMSGEAWHFEVSTVTGATTTDGFYLRVLFGVTEDFARFDTDVVFTDVVSDAGVDAGGWTEWKGDVVVPADVRWARVALYWWNPNVATECYFDRVIAQKYAATVQNDGATVTIDDAGITVTDGAITVTNSAATVIIDGESDIFKIFADGTIALTVADQATGNTDVTVNDATLSHGTCPAFNAFVIDGGGANPWNFLGTRVLPVQKFVAGTSGGAVTTRALVASKFAHCIVREATFDDATVRLEAWNESGASEDFDAKYYIFREAAF